MHCPRTSLPCSRRHTQSRIFVDGRRVCDFLCAELFAHAQGRILYAESITQHHDLMTNVAERHIETRPPRQVPPAKPPPEDLLWEEHIFPRLEHQFKEKKKRDNTGQP